MEQCLLLTQNANHSILSPTRCMEGRRGNEREERKQKLKLLSEGEVGDSPHFHNWILLPKKY